MFTTKHMQLFQRQGTNADMHTLYEAHMSAVSKTASYTVQLFLIPNIKSKFDEVPNFLSFQHDLILS